MKNCFLIIILLMASDLTLLDADDNSMVLKEGIKAGREILRILGKEAKYTELLKISDQLMPFFDGLGDALSNTSQKQDEYVKLEKEYSELEKYYGKTKGLMNGTMLRDNYFPSVQIIDLYMDMLVDALKAPVPEDDTATSPYQNFVDSYKVNFDDSTDQILKGANLSIPKAIMCHTSNWVYYTRQYIKGMIFLLFKGMRVSAAFHKLDDPESYVEKYKVFIEKLKAVIDETPRLDNDVKSKWLTQAQTDIALKYAKSNKSAEIVASEAFTALKKKFHWRDWFVAVFSPLEFKKDYYHKFCDAFDFVKPKKAKQQWNVIVASVDKSKNKIDKTRVTNMMKAADTRIKKCKDPIDVFRIVHYSLRGSCETVNFLGVMKREKKGKIVYSVKAEKDRFFLVNGNCKMWAFG